LSAKIGNLISTRLVVWSYMQPMTDGTLSISVDVFLLPTVAFPDFPTKINKRS
jgi:hypothetical protein